MDDVWGTDEETNARDYVLMQDAFTNTGYREGIIAGKESALQSGFDQAFTEVGVPSGRRFGMLRGLATALSAYLEQQGLEEPRLEAREIVSRLSRMHLEDIASPDFEAIAHAKEHLDNASQDIHEQIEEDKSIRGKAELDVVQNQLQGLLSKRGLPIDLASLISS
ncbi:hypothetical protein SISNIDRAFT_453341 [Sistotremastrum niveocremeum HHB9708]|uniref:Protein YAE1 n=1 Tax=Sistotremastrum niveocremeum HHB9708 TaxID=1314777 RepID=A0A164VSP4_9AGAM|nr:hypothetical protein SISNIDRAFT_453341 [Sistotremastrum niveocremeum HHB9708]